MMSQIFSLFRLRLRCLFPIFALLSLLFLDCSSSGAAPDNKENVNTAAGSVPVTKPITPKKLERYHYWGNYRLERNGDSYQLDTTVNQYRYGINEIRPGILSLNRGARHEEDADRFPPNLIALEFYDTLTHQLKKRVDLGKMSPYKPEQYKNLKIGGGLDYEYMEIYGPDTNCQWPSLPKPNNFISTNQRMPSVFGYNFIGFALAHLADYKVVGWENSLGIFDASGALKAMVKIDKEPSSCAVSKQGKFLCYATYAPRNSTSEPWEDCTNRLIIYDLQRKSIVFSREFPNHPVGILPYVFDPELYQPSSDFGFAVYYEKYKTLFYLDEDNRAVHEYSITNEEYSQVCKQKSVKSILNNKKTSSKI